MDDTTLAVIAARIMAVFLLQHGYHPSEVDDITEPHFFKRSGEHIIISLCGKAMAGAELNIDVLWNRYAEYIAKNNRLPAAQKFSPFDMKRFDYPDGTFLVISLCQ